MAILRNGAPTGSSLAERTVIRLARGGVLLPGQPDFPQENLPEDITGISDEDLIELFVRLTEWTGYLSTRAAAAAVDEKAAESALVAAEAEALVAVWGGTSKDRVNIAKAERSTDPEVVRLRQVYEERYAERKLLESIASNSDRKASLVSRELTRRTSGPAPERRARGFTS